MSGANKQTVKHTDKQADRKTNHGMEKAHRRACCERQRHDKRRDGHRQIISYDHEGGTHRSQTPVLVLNLLEDLPDLSVLILQGANAEPQSVQLTLILADLVAEGADLLAVVLGLVLVGVDTDKEKDNKQGN